MTQYPKSISNINQLVKKLSDAGMTLDVPNPEEALTTIGYYRLKGYWFHKYNNSTKQFQANTNFTDIVDLYNFDSEFSRLIFSFLSKIEIALRTRTVDALSIYNDQLILSDPSIFKDKEKYWKNQSTIANEIARSNDVFIKHNFANHHGLIPVWSSVEIMSFGSLSKVLMNLSAGANTAYNKLAQYYTYQSNNNAVVPSHEMLTSWVKAACAIRNVCAHNGRIYNRAFTTLPKLLKNDVISPAPNFKGIYYIMLGMKYLRPTDDMWNDFVNDFKSLLNKYANVVTAADLHFPVDWTNHL